MPTGMLVQLTPKGIFKNLPRHLIPDGGVFVADGMTEFKGELGTAPGYKKFITTTLAGAEVMNIDEFPMESGVSHLLAFSNTKAYRFDGTTWVDITRQVAAVDVDYTGGLDDGFQADVVVNPGGDLFYVVTNSKKDPVHKWDGNTANRLTKLAGSPFDAGDHFSKSVAAFQNHLMHLNRTEAGTAKPRMLRWSDNGVPEVYAGGEAGFLTLFQGASHGVSLHPLSTYLAAYRERAIHLVTFVGSPFFMAQRQVIDGVGLAAEGALLNLDQKHVFLGNDNVYIFNGIDVEPIGDQIRDEIFESTDPANLSRSVIMLSEPRNEMMLIMPSTSGGGIPDTWWFWNLTTGAWSGPIRNRKLTAGGVFERRSNRSWDSATGTWDQQSGAWDSAANIAAFPVNLFGNQLVTVYELDPLIALEDGTPFTGRVETRSVDPGQQLFKPPVREAVCTSIQPFGSEAGAPSVNWFIGTSDNPTGPFPFQGPFTRGVRGYVPTKPIRGKWFVFAAESPSAFRLDGFIASFEPAGG